ncbi:hypothetical protein [Dactylosporangium sp. NPDC051484]
MRRATPGARRKRTHSSAAMPAIEPALSIVRAAANGGEMNP